MHGYFMEGKYMDVNILYHNGSNHIYDMGINLPSNKRPLKEIIFNRIE